ncbi:hypothetical protein [Scytonema sp. PCC 10023]|uniref:hypothetical protein n=1 Tax=Scytonema sp. PCC 10023 TaxID=1680591 RepID=UPI0039C6ED14
MQFWDRDGKIPSILVKATLHSNYPCTSKLLRLQVAKRQVTKFLCYGLDSPSVTMQLKRATAYLARCQDDPTGAPASLGQPLRPNN